jgi:hypothetical protein
MAVFENRVRESSMRIHALHISLWSTLVIGAVLSGCSRYGGVTSGVETVSHGTDLICYAYQLPPSTSGTPKRPVYLIVWLAKLAGSTTVGPGNLLTGIHGHPISVNPDKKAVYALQPDYSLKELSLTPAEIDDLLSNREEAQASMMHDKPPKLLEAVGVFKEKVFPQLKYVEWTKPAPS